jgi:tRNA-U20-dihydrouridine synthase
MHGRTRLQMYEGKANWDILKEVKENIHIPFIGNGDVETPEDAKRLLEYTGADGVMIGRAALGNPWMIYRTVEYLKSGKLTPEPPIREKMDVCLLHFDRLMKLKGESIAVREMRKHASWYLKGVRGNGKARNRINQAETALELHTILNELVEEIEGQENIPEYIQLG